MDANNIRSSNDNNVKSFFERLYDFHFRDRTGQLTVYSIAFISSVIYMAVDSLLSFKPEQKIEPETILIGLIFAGFVVLFMPIAIIYPLSLYKEDDISFSIGRVEIYNVK